MSSSIPRRVLLRRAVRRWWLRLRAPWPLVSECFSSHIPGHRCEQCQPSHTHRFKPWPNAPRGYTIAGVGTPVRCVHCGGRKCDVDGCDLVRHHGAHP